MKRIKLLVFMMLGISWIVQSCNKDDVKPEDNKSSKPSDYFFVKSAEDNVVRQLDIGLLELIKKDLEEKKRFKDAELLINTYDSKTGKLKAEFEDEAKRMSKSSKVAAVEQYSLNVLVDGFWSNYYTNITTGTINGIPYQQGGTTGSNTDMLAFSIFAPLSSGYNLEYCVHRGNVGWESYKSNGQQTNWCECAQEVQAFRIRIVRTNYSTPTKNYSVFYQAHVANFADIGYGDGWMQWVGNDVIAGTTGQSRSCQAMKVAIFTY